MGRLDARNGRRSRFRPGSTVHSRPDHRPRGRGLGRVLALVSGPRGDLWPPGGEDFWWGRSGSRLHRSWLSCATSGTLAGCLGDATPRHMPAEQDRAGLFGPVRLLYLECDPCIADYGSAPEKEI